MPSKTFVILKKNFLITLSTRDSDESPGVNYKLSNPEYILELSLGAIIVKFAEIMSRTYNLTPSEQGCGSVLRNKVGCGSGFQISSDPDQDFKIWSDRDQVRASTS